MKEWPRRFLEKCKLPFAQATVLRHGSATRPPLRDTSPRSKPIFDLRKPDVRKY